MPGLQHIYSYTGCWRRFESGRKLSAWKDGYLPAHLNPFGPPRTPVGPWG